MNVANAAASTAMHTCGRGFDAAGYKTAFRTACHRRGIDPLLGASVYQAANVRAEQRKTEKRRLAREERDQQGGGTWWTKPEYWLDFPPDHSDVERMVFAYLFHVALSISLAQIRKAVAGEYA